MSEEKSVEIGSGKRPNFLGVPLEIFLNMNISDGGRRLFAVFLLYKNSKHGCWATNNYLSRMTALDQRSVSRAIAVLEKWGYIEVKNKKSTSLRRIFIADYEKKYKEVADKIYEMRKNIDKFDVLVYNKMFLEARDK